MGSKSDLREEEKNGERKEPLLQLPDKQDGDKHEPLLQKPEQLTQEKRGDPGHVTQILVVIGISFGCYIHGTSVVWPIVIPKLLSESNASLANTTEGTYIGYTLDPERDVSWIVSIFVLGNFIGGVASAPLSNTLGRKLASVLGIGVTFALSYVLVLTAVEVSMLYLARVLMGIALGVSHTVSTIYIQDIATPDIRGSLGAIPAVTGALGVFSFQILNAFLDWRHLNIACACLSIPYTLFIFLAPESPVFLVSRNRMSAARKSLKRLRGKDWDVAGELEDIKERLGKGLERRYMPGTI